MKSNLFKSCLLASAVAAASQTALAGEAVFYVTEDGEAVDSISVTVDGQKKLVGKNGFVVFDLGGGNHSVELSQFGEWAGEFEFSAAKNQNAEIQVEMIGGEAVQEVSVYTPGQEQSVALGKVSGYLESDETGGGVEGAIISVEGLELSVTTDGEGYYELEIPRGEYTLNVAHPNYGNREVKNLRVISNVATNVNLNMSMSGDSMIEEVVAVGSYIPSTATAQQRDSGAVLNAIGSEQLSRFGDSNAASALKRVAGVSISGGKYVVSRGLNERHSTIMLNGASLPSPDPSRRVVPLDIFPSTVIDNIAVQKTFTPEVYADSTGAAVKLDTKKFPSEFEGKISASLGFVAGTTFEDEQIQQSEGGDVFGFGATGDRKLPSVFKQWESLSSIEKSLNPALQQEVNEAFSSNLATEKTTLNPDVSLEVSMGDTVVDDGNKQIGYTASVKYSNTWEVQDRERNVYELDGGDLIAENSFDETRVSNDINLGFGLSLGLIAGDSEYSSNTLLLRQTHAESSIIEGITGDQFREAVTTRLSWNERQFLLQQFTGDHYVPELGETDVKWQFSVSQASLESPDERTYSFERDQGSSDPFFLYWSSVDRVYNELTDDNTDFSLDASSLVFSNDDMQAKVKYGFSMFSRERSSEGSTVQMSGPGQTADEYENLGQDIDAIVDAATDTGIANITSGSAPSDDYDATWDLTAYYLTADLEWFDSVKVSLGARAENSEMVLDTFTIGSTISNPDPQQAVVEDNDLFPSVSATYSFTEEVQARAVYYETKNRPDFRELANTQFFDPESGDAFRGNPTLESAEITNADLRLEYYFSDSESVTFAYFTKDFTNPIERTLLTGGDVKSWKNGEEGTLSGIELDFRKEYDFNAHSIFVSGNLAVIDSEVTIEVAGTMKTQAMQGQPNDLANLQLGFDDLENGTEYTLLMNYKGEALGFVSDGDEPNVLIEPRSQIDFNVSQEVGEMTLKAKLKNITDEPVHETQGGLTYRKYSKGVELSLGLSMPF